MVSQDPVIASAYAGLIAASSAIAAKRVVRRPPFLAVAPPRIRVPMPADIPSLLGTTHDSGEFEHKLARVTAASLLYSLERKAGGYAERVLEPGERKFLHAIDDVRKAHDNRKDTRCYYCELSSDALYGEDPPFKVVRHSARVVPDFDPDTNISSAAIKNYQLLAPKSVALKLLRSSHPLRWCEAAPNLFKQSDPAVQSNGPGRPWQPVELSTDRAKREEQIRDWESDTADGRYRYIYEAVTWPWNGQVSTEIDNVIRISDLEIEPNSLSSKLKFGYSLQACLESNFGLARERGGLDIDDGDYDGEACHWQHIEPRHLEGLTDRDLAHLETADNLDLFVDPKSEVVGPIPPEQLKSKAVPRIQEIAQRFEKAWRRQGFNEDCWLITISESKRLRYTAPGNTPVDLWAALTWMAPAVLFAFVNRAVCQPANGDLDGLTGKVSSLGPRARPSGVHTRGPRRDADKARSDETKRRAAGEKS